MKKILITGAAGYIGRNITKALLEYKDQVELTTLTHQDLDLTNKIAVDNFFKDKMFDWIIHCAIQGGRYNDIEMDDYIVCRNNIAMFNNISDNKKHYYKLLSFGSGAELDRKQNINQTSNLWVSRPTDNYGYSKNIIAKCIDYGGNGLYNIRLFGIFSADELPDRFIKANLMRYIRNEPMIIHQNKYMDFFAMEDLMTVVKNYIFNDDILILPKHLDAVYEYTCTLTKICDFINRLDASLDLKCKGKFRKVEIQIQKEGMNLDYVGTYNKKFMKYCNVLQDIESIWYRISVMYTKLKETYETESR
jgi:nucleoside-diphosphate-sugar epimerase